MMRIVFFSGLLLLLSCQPSEKQANKVSPFFDLATFFEQEIESLGTDRPIKKTILLNDKTEILNLDRWDPRPELEGFKELHINRPAWRDQYQVDSSFYNDGGLSRLMYTAIDSSLRIKQVEIDWTAAGEVEEVRVEKYIKNLVVLFHQKLRYNPGRGYWLWRAQKVPLSKRSEMEIELSY